MSKTAALHLSEVAGYAGPAECYRLSPPRVFDGLPYEYVTLCRVPRFGNMPGELKVYPATETGACATHTLQKRVGSFAIDDDYAPGDTAYEDGLRRWALGMLGGYEITGEAS